ncbi:MAG: Asp/Glu/hydantoin racemase [Bacteroidales bacterium]|nr:Asp/Glu/hydantoin racemase [Bacteroidales bacterium]
MKYRLLLKKAFRILSSVTLFSLAACKSGSESKVESNNSVVSKALKDKTSIYYANYSDYPKNLKSLPIGIFDSGTGGLTVLEQFLALDNFNNETGEEVPDGIPDFEGEEFIYLADQANMPYGVYSSQGKEDFLRELIIKDALFLTKEPNRSKIVVIACNTATAFGLEDVEGLLESSKTGVKTIGVINAGVEGAMKPISVDEELFAIGVLATVGTISSGGYRKTIKSYADNNDYRGDVRVVSHGGLGFAEAIDSEPDYICADAKETRGNYRGPVYGSIDGIKPELLPLYNFNYTDNALLIKRESDGSIVDIQLNSTGNYARFHLVSLLNKHREENPGVKLKSIILGCTHYPYVIDTLTAVIEELRDYKEEDVKVFNESMDEAIFFVDPAVNTAREAFMKLYAANMLNRKHEENKIEAYISIPHSEQPQSALDSIGNLSFDFKYGREVDSDSLSVRVVPFSTSNINSKNLMRIEERLPLSYSLIKKNLK